MSTNTKLKKIEELEEYIKEKLLVLTGILDTLGWTQESLAEEVKVCCPINSEHWVPESALSNHIETCKWSTNGYVKEELKKQPPDSSIFYQKSSNVVPVQIDHAVTEKILSENGLINMATGYDSSADFPQTIDRWTVHLNPEQRLAVYDYIVEVSKASEKAKNVTLEDLMIDFEKKDDQESRPKSHLEILAELRDYKRRRQSYRAKNVHITKKSYTEIMKEVIENQTNYLADIRKQENNEHREEMLKMSSILENNKKEICSHTDRDDESHRGKHSGNADYSSSDDSSRYKEHHSRHKSEKDDSRKRHHSKHKSSKNYSPKRKKHKDRSRSRSPSHHKHKKSHKRKRSRD